VKKRREKEKKKKKDEQATRAKVVASEPQPWHEYTVVSSRAKRRKSFKEKK